MHSLPVVVTFLSGAAIGKTRKALSVMGTSWEAVVHGGGGLCDGCLPLLAGPEGPLRGAITFRQILQISR